jgi:YD repeat-containing protein
MSTPSRLVYAAGLAVIASGLGLGLWAAWDKVTSTVPASPDLGRRSSDSLVAAPASIALPSQADKVPAGLPTYQYNAGGQLTRILYPDSTSYKYAYDSHGNKIQETDRNGKTWLYIYDAHQHPVTVIDPQGHTTTVAAGNNRR